MASIDLNWPPKVLPQPQDFPWGGNIFQSYLSTQNLRPLSLLELLQIGFVISQICIDFANLHIIMISPQKAFLKKILWLFWVDMKVTNSKISMIPTKLSFCIWVSFNNSVVIRSIKTEDFHVKNVRRIFDVKMS